MSDVEGSVSEKKRIEHSALALAIKRFFDLIISLAVLALIWPIFLVIALAIKLTSPGPVFYRGVRGGLHEKSFQIFKFRTMVLNAESLGGPTTGSNDSRITTVGLFLRRTKLDEFPQFLNVLLGDMSLVGPRPEVLEYTNQYKGDELLILAMRPGITDYASIEFADLDDRVGKEDPDAFFKKNILPRKNKLRVKYVKEWSNFSDFTILFRTFLRVVRRVFHR